MYSYIDYEFEANTPEINSNSQKQQNLRIYNDRYEEYYNVIVR